MTQVRRAWFRPKLFGVGVGPPVAWQGWVVVGCYLTGLVWAVAVLAGWEPRAMVALLSAALLGIARGRMTEPMGWRWGPPRT